MTETIDNPRLEQFKAEMAAMRVKPSDPARDAQRLRLGAGLLLAGVVVGVVALLVSHGTENALQQRDAIVIALLGVTIAVAGLAVYLRYALTIFLRVWLARMLFDQQH